MSRPRHTIAMVACIFIPPLLTAKLKENSNDVVPVFSIAPTLHLGKSALVVQCRSLLLTRQSAQRGTQFLHNCIANLFIPENHFAELWLRPLYFDDLFG